MYCPTSILKFGLFSLENQYRTRNNLEVYELQLDKEGDEMKGIGVDIVEFDRIRAVKNRAKFVDKILNEKEKAVLVTFKNEDRQLEYLAGRWAAKEALYKADNQLADGHAFTDFAILNDESGAPYLEIFCLTGEWKCQKVHLTISHSDNYAVAFVVLS